MLLTGGHGHVFGPAKSDEVEDNNSLGFGAGGDPAAAELSAMPRRSSIVSGALLVIMGLTLVAIIGTYSRGALLALRFQR